MSRYNVEIFDRALLDEANERRAARGLDELQVNAQLEEGVEQHLVNNGFTHANTQAGNYGAGEILYSEYGYSLDNPEAFAERVIAGWEGSSGHAAILFDPDAALVGIGVAMDQNSNEVIAGQWVYDI